MTRADTSGSHSSPRSLAERELVGVQVLAVDRDPQVRDGITHLLGGIGVHVTATDDGDRALAAVTRDFFSVVLVDIDTPVPGAGLTTIAEIRARSPSSMIIALTPRRSFDDAVAAIRAGAVDLVLKEPESVEYLQERVRVAADRSQGKRVVDSLLDDVRTTYDEFLQRFMDAERRSLDLADQVAGRAAGVAPQLDELRVLVADEVDELAAGLTEAAPPGYEFVHATSGGEALDRAGTAAFHYAMIAEDLSDLPATTVARTIRTQYPDTVVLLFRGPADNGKVELVETNRQRVIVEPFREVGQLVARLDELAAAWRAKARERRYTQAFRERHFDFLRRFVELKTKIARAQGDER
jgi:CheY-like chemotaxis protein